tara:strand:- start:535 stop:873 length:339 start_codon:yes stop_codon:yes gene_type:complete
MANKSYYEKYFIDFFDIDTLASNINKDGGLNFSEKYKLTKIANNLCKELKTNCNDEESNEVIKSYIRDALEKLFDINDYEKAQKYIIGFLQEQVDNDAELCEKLYEHLNKFS